MSMIERNRDASSFGGEWDEWRRSIYVHLIYSRLLFAKVFKLIPKLWEPREQCFPRIDDKKKSFESNQSKVANRCESAICNYTLWRF